MVDQWCIAEWPDSQRGNGSDQRHSGYSLSWAEATRDRRIELHGPSWLVRAFPTWNGRSAFAHIKPVSTTEARLAG
jgi:hypothetical protein